MKLPCAVTRDLLPLYAEELVEPETGKYIEEHLADCPACREMLSGLKAEAAAPPEATPLETVKPLQSLKRQIRKRRLMTAAIAALCVFVAIFTFFAHENEMHLVPWEEGLIEVKGIEERPREAAGEDGTPAGSRSDAVDVLVLRADGRINGTHESVFLDEDGSRTLLLQGWTSGHRSMAKEEHELTFFPVPDRVIYEGNNQQKLLWGKPLDGGVETLPRLALGYYALFALGFALLSGVLWFFFRKHHSGQVFRQVFFAPLAWLLAHLLIKGFRTTSFFMERDFIGIVILTAALYALLTLSWQVLLQRKKEAL